MMAEDTLPEADVLPGAPHPREAAKLFGQEAAEATFLAAHASGALHSAWLLTGPRGIGKATFAWRAARFLLAEPAPAGDGLFGAPPPPASLDVDPDHPDARLLASGAHPQLFVLRRGWDEKAKALRTQIGVDEVRNLRERFLRLSAPDGKRRVVILDPVDEMTVSAANALLKELEEPPARVTFFIVCHQPARLLPTIRSRCRELRLHPLDPDSLSAALAQAGLDLDGAEALAALAQGSAGEAIRLARADGLKTYAEIVGLLDGLPRLDRAAALKLADGTGGRAGAARFELILDLLDRFLARVARAGLAGEPHVQGAPGEARLLTRLCPSAAAARDWADLQASLSARLRHGQAVNVDPAALLLDAFLKIEATARRHAG